MSLFAPLVASATAIQFNMFAEEISVDTLDGKGIISDTQMMNYADLEVHGGAELTTLISEFPDLAVGSTVLRGGIEYRVMEVMDPDSFGWQKSRLARF